MSKYSLVIIACLLAAVVVFSAYQTLSNPDENKKEARVLFPDQKLEEVDIEVALDKEVYHSNEEANISVKISSNQEIKNLMLEVVGLKNKYGRDYIKERKEISLGEGDNNILSFSKQLPECSRCVGFIENEYEIEAKVLRGDYTLAKDKIKFNFKP